MFSDISSSEIDGTDMEESIRVGSPSLKLHSFWNMEPVYIQVYETLFVVPREAFTDSESGGFFDAVSASSLSAAVENIEGLSKTRPLFLDNVTVYEFETFLQVIYPSRLSERLKLDITLQDWAIALRLSTVWDHEIARKRAIASLTHILKGSDDATSMLRLGKEHSVTQWIRDAYISLIRNLNIDMVELSQPPFDFSWETIAKIIQARYEAIPKPEMSTPSKKLIPRRSCSGCASNYFSASGSLQICLCRATAAFKQYFPDLDDSKPNQTPFGTTTTSGY